MSRLSTFALGVITGAAGIIVSENYYIVRSKESHHIVPKIAARLEFPYRDIRNYSYEDWQNNQSLALAIIKSQKQELLMETGLNRMQQQFDSLLKSLTGS